MRVWLALYVVTGVVAAIVSDLAGASQNLMVFRAAADALVRSAPMYARFSWDFDFYKYSPTFALLFWPFAKLPFHVSGVLWSALNFAACAWGMLRLARVLWPDDAARQGARFLLLAYPGIVLTTDGDQSNLLMAGACFLSLALYLEKKPAAAAPWLAFSILLKIFPVVFGVYALVGKQRWRALGALFVATLVLVVLPAAVVGPARLVAYYDEWRVLLAGEPAHASVKHWSLMHTATDLGLAVTSVPLQIAGSLVFLVGAAFYLYDAHKTPKRPERELWFVIAAFSFVLLFNHRSESPTFVLSGLAAGAFVLVEPRPRAWHWLFFLALVLAPSPLHSQGGATDLHGWLVAKRLFHPLRLLPLTALWLLATWRLVRPRVARDESLVR